MLSFLLSLLALAGLPLTNPAPSASPARPPSGADPSPSPVRSVCSGGRPGSGSDRRPDLHSCHRQRRLPSAPLSRRGAAEEVVPHWHHHVPRQQHGAVRRHGAGRGTADRHVDLVQRPRLDARVVQRLHRLRLERIHVGQPQRDLQDRRGGVGCGRRARPLARRGVGIDQRRGFLVEADEHHPHQRPSSSRLRRRVRRRGRYHHRHRRTERGARPQRRLVEHRLWQELEAGRISAGGVAARTLLGAAADAEVAGAEQGDPVLHGRIQQGRGVPSYLPQRLPHRHTSAQCTQPHIHRALTCVSALCVRCAGCVGEQQRG